MGPEYPSGSYELIFKVTFKSRETGVLVFSLFYSLGIRLGKVNSRSAKTSGTWHTAGMSANKVYLIAAK